MLTKYLGHYSRQLLKFKTGREEGVPKASPAFRSRLDNRYFPLGGDR
jgi:hypothetical protein